MHGLQACAVLILYLKAMTVSNSVHSSTEEIKQTFKHWPFFRFSHRANIQNGKAGKWKKNIEWLLCFLCFSRGSEHALPFASLCPSFCFHFPSPLTSQQLLFFRALCSYLCQLVQKILRDVTNFTFFCCFVCVCVELHFWQVYLKTTVVVFKCTEKFLWYTEYL